MKEIHLSHSSESVFRIIRDLYEADKEHCLEDMITRVDDTRIETADRNVFVLSDEEEVSEHGDYAFTKKGATWFNTLRDTTGGVVDNGNRTWIKFIEDVSRRFHDKYAFLEYFHDKNRERDVKEATERTIIASLCETLGVEYDNIIKTAGDISYAFYGVTLKLVLSKNGFFQPVLAKMLFSNGRAMKQDVAERIIHSLTTQEGTNEAKLRRRAKSRENREFKIEEINNLLVEFFDELKTDGNLMDYLILAGEEDLNAIRLLEGYDASPIICDNIKLLNLFYADWPSHGFDITADGEPIYRFTFGPGELVSMTCACGEQIICDNRITCVNKEEETETEFVLDISHSKEQFGLDAEELAYLSIHSPTRCHALPIRCPENIRHIGGCHRRRCLADTVSFDNSGRLYCDDCPFVEVITHVDGKPTLTETLVYSTNSRRLVTRDSVRSCEICNRPFDNLTTGGICSVCGSLQSENITPGSPNERRAKRLYRNYSHMLSLSNRFFSKKPRMCAEDEQIVVFRLGKKNYLYDKRTGSFKRIKL